jgi:hypothetical protein
MSSFDEPLLPNASSSARRGGGDPRFSPTPTSASESPNGGSGAESGVATKVATEGLLSPSTIEKATGETLGGKDIGFGLSVIFLINQIYGPV